MTNHTKKEYTIREYAFLVDQVLDGKGNVGLPRQFSESQAIMHIQDIHRKDIYDIIWGALPSLKKFVFKEIVRVLKAHNGSMTQKEMAALVRAFNNKEYFCYDTPGHEGEMIMLHYSTSNVYGSVLKPARRLGLIKFNKTTKFWSLCEDFFHHTVSWGIYWRREIEKTGVPDKLQIPPKTPETTPKEEKITANKDNEQVPKE